MISLELIDREEEERTEICVFLSCVLEEEELRSGGCVLCSLYLRFAFCVKGK
jgi:ferredoxin-thioredoxin reductase catalytic subunit